ncbi:MAG: hypothetical protein ACRC7U_05405 [Moraxella sp.]
MPYFTVILLVCQDEIAELVVSCLAFLVPPNLHSPSIINGG